MTEEKKNVFEQLQESLAIIAEKLDEANNALYVVASTSLDLSDKLDELTAKLDAFIGAATKVTEKPAEAIGLAQPEIPELSFEKLRKERK